MSRQKPEGDGKSTAHKWQFRARFRRHSFGWRSQPAIKRVKEAVSEIKKVARKDRVLAAEGAVLFLEKVSPALERVDSSSGAMGTAVSNAVAALVEILVSAQVDPEIRQKWLERLFESMPRTACPTSSSWPITGGSSASHPSWLPAGWTS